MREVPVTSVNIGTGIGTMPEEVVAVVMELAVIVCFRLKLRAAPLIPIAHHAPESSQRSRDFP